MSRAGKLMRIILAKEDEGDDVEAIKERRHKAITALAPLLGVKDGRGTFSTIIRMICDAAEVAPGELAHFINESLRDDLV